MDYHKGLYILKHYSIERRKERFFINAWGHEEKCVGSWERKNRKTVIKATTITSAFGIRYKIKIKYSMERLQNFNVSTY